MSKYKLQYLILSTTILLSVSIVCTAIFFAYSHPRQDKIYIDTSTKEEDVKAETIITQQLFEITAGDKLEIPVPAGAIILNDQQIIDFTSIKERGLELSPAINQFGRYNFNISYSKGNQKYQENIFLKIHRDIKNLQKLENQIIDILGRQKNNYAVSVTDLKRGLHFSINGDQIKPPASISKIPYAILVLRDIDQNKYNLDSTYNIRGSSKAYTFDFSYSFPIGTPITLDEYIKYLIQKSDNTAMMHLEAFLGGNTEYNQRVENELGLTNLFRRPHTTTANQVDIMLQNIYFQNYLSKESNDYLIETMTNTETRFHDRIKAGVPEDAIVAHKIGNLSGVFQDTGIVYGDKTDFSITILNQRTSETEAKKTIPEITETVYKFLN